jgi:glycosyltransferase involved in cell wall biosynthesis
MIRPTKVVLLSFEGPDVYSQVGGLGVRVTELADALAYRGYDVDLIFIGDPNAPPIEERGPRLRLRRWSQWISAYHPRDVYDGETGKMNDYTASVPRFVAEEIVAPASARGERVLIMAEEWHTVPATIALDRLLRERHLRHSATILWNANNTYGFWTIDWAALHHAATITTISKYMKFEVAAASGVQPLVVNNGIPSRLLDGAPKAETAAWRSALGERPTLVKVGRFDPDKRWFQAIDALERLIRSEDVDTRLVIRGGNQAYGHEVLARARNHGLEVTEIERVADDNALFDAVARAPGQIIDLKVFLTQELLYGLYAAGSAVLANSGKEPFGLVGLEVMAAGGLAVCGSTGEEYAEPYVNSIVVDTDDGRELATALISVMKDEKLAVRMRSEGYETAKRFTWPTIIDALERKLEFIEAAQFEKAF